MKLVIFNGALERRTNATSHKIAQHFKHNFEVLGWDVQVFEVGESGIPLFDVTLANVPRSVEIMSSIFRSADHHIWLSPLYHGGMTGVMKNCLDWLETTAKESSPYLSDKKVGLVCWADGSQAMQGINNMDAVAKSLRAWPLPYSIAAIRKDLYGANGGFSTIYRDKFEKMTRILAKRNTNDLY